MTPPVRLRVLPPDVEGDEWDVLWQRLSRLSRGYPETYGDCVVGRNALCPTKTGTLEQRLVGRRQCGVLACPNNLLTLRSEDVQGRRHNGRPPEWTVSGEADAMAPSCAIDMGNQGARTCAEIAALTGLTKRRIQQLVRQGVQALEREGVDVEEMLRLLEQEERKR